MAKSEIDVFIDTWNEEAKKTVRLFQALPRDRYDFRPDAGGRSIGELAWHLSEIDGCISLGIEVNRFSFDDKVPGLERPRTVEALAPGYERIHADAVSRVRKLSEKDLDREIRFYDGSDLTVRTILWVTLLHHLIHHRGALSLMCRLAGGTTPGLYGPNREEMAAMKAGAKA